jgi:nitrite reductase (cytochrome c-552)
MKKTIVLLIVLCVVVAAATFAVTALLMNIQSRKAEGKDTYVKLVELTEDDVDPAKWGENFPREYDGYKRTSDIERTKYGGSEALSKLDADPRLLRIFSGYAFALDYREERGHAYSLLDQEQTKRVTEKQQPGSCLQCHASILPAYRQAGDGDIMKGFEKLCAMPYEEAHKLVDHPISCIDCHDPQTMALRVTRPGFLNGIREYMKSKGIENYDPNTMATRQEMRSFVCGQCHVEYYFKGDGKLVTYPWSKGLKIENIYDYYTEAGFKDWAHKETGAPVLKAQHPEFEMWNQGVHARANVACADCHMPYMRQGALKVSDHHIRSPLLNIERSCLVCHPFSKAEMEARVFTIQDRNAALLSRAEDALVQLYDEINAARAAGIADDKLAGVWELQRRAQFYTDFVNAENSMGFHAPQEAARILGEAIDYARQGELQALLLRTGGSPAPAGPPPAPPEAPH